MIILVARRAQPAKYPRAICNTLKNSYRIKINIEFSFRNE